MAQSLFICHCVTALSRRSNLMLQGDCFVAKNKSAPRNDIIHYLLLFLNSASSFLEAVISVKVITTPSIMFSSVR